MDPRNRRTQPERWLPVAGYEGKYEVSDRGRVQRIGSGRGSNTRYIMSSWSDDQGRPKVTLRNPDGYVQRTISTLVAAAFLGPRPEGLDVCHRNGINTCNLPGNLYYGTKRQNMADKLTHGTQPLGGSSHLAKRTIEQVREVRAALERGERACDIARRLNVPEKWISDVKQGVSWKHIK